MAQNEFFTGSSPVRGIAGIEQERLGSLISCDRWVQLPAPRPNAGVAQWVEQAFRKREIAGSSPASSSKLRMWCNGSISGFQPADTSSSLVIRSNPVRVSPKGWASIFYIDLCGFESYHSRQIWVCSLIGKASALQAEGYRFDSDRLHCD
jgi:hypothetical protein